MTYDPNNNIYTSSRPSGTKPPKHPCLTMLLTAIAIIVVGFLLLTGLCFIAANSNH